MFNTYKKQTIPNNTFTHFSKLIIDFSIFINLLSPSLSTIFVFINLLWSSLSTIFVAVSSLSSSFFIGPHLSSTTFSLHHEKKLYPTTSSLPPCPTKNQHHQLHTNYKIRFSKSKIRKKTSTKQQISYLELWATPKFSPPVLSRSSSSRDCLFTAIANRC